MEKSHHQHRTHSSPKTAPRLPCKRRNHHLGATRPKKPRFNVPATPGDLDKYLRAIGDGIEQAGILKNDARITHWTATKHYATNTNPPGAHITITWKDNQ